MSDGNPADRTDSTVAGDQVHGADDIQVLPAGLVRLSDPSVGATGPDGPSTVARAIAHRGRVNQASADMDHARTERGRRKSMLGVGLAVETAARRGPACIADIDPQGTAISWSDERQQESDPVVTATQANRLERVQAACREAKVLRLIIDTAAGTSSGTLEAAKLADLIIIPCQPAGPDLYAMKMTATFVQLANRPGLFVLNRGTMSGNTRSSKARDFLAALGAKYGINVCPIAIMNRMAHVKAYEIGKTAREFEPRSKAAQEMEALEKWITEHHG